jgi:sugar lactone lactonase YvrE
MKEQTSELFFDARAVLAEGPGYNADTNTILWVDIESGIINELDFSTRLNRQAILGGKTGFAVHGSDDSVVAGTAKGLARVDMKSGTVDYVVNPESELPGNRFNDGKVGPDGCIWAGTMSLTEEEGAGSFYRIDPSSLESQKQFGGVTISNGLAWTADGSVLYYIDTPTMKVSAFDFDVASGTISNRRTVIEIPEGVGYPDGMTIDDEGMLWIAMWAGWGVLRFNPATGEIIGKINVPVECVSACCFAGPDRDSLIITTSSRDLTDEKRPAQPHAGSLFIARPGVTGPTARIFNREKR